MGKFFLKTFFIPVVYVQNDQRVMGIIFRYGRGMVKVPTDPPLGTPAADRLSPPPLPPPSRPPKVFAPDWVSRFEPATPLGRVGELGQV